MNSKVCQRFKIRTLLAIAGIATLAQPAYALTDLQAEGLYRHGIWEWSLRNCPYAMRQNGYWYALKEVAGFSNASEIVGHEDSEPFKAGWDYMAGNYEEFGLERTCDYAYEQWPAVLYDGKP